MKPSWRIKILPFVYRDHLYNEIARDEKKPLPDWLASRVVRRYVSIRAPSPTDTFYRVFVGNGAAFERDRPVSMDEFADGLENTILVVEANEPINWTSTNELDFDPEKPLPKLGYFPEYFHALMGDGSVRKIRRDTEEANLKAMITRNGGEKTTLRGTKYNYGYR